jgi:YHYH protein
MEFRLGDRKGHHRTHPPRRPFERGGFKGHPSEHVLGQNQVRIFDRDGYRYIVGNGFPSHESDFVLGRQGVHPIRPQQYFFRVPLRPIITNRIVAIHRQPFGVALNGVPFDPESAEFWNSDRQSGWQYEAMARPGLDRNRGHTRANGAYHYHGLPVGLIASLGRDRQMVELGYAADGFPIYNQYDTCDPSHIASAVRKVCSSYRLKEGQRINGPRNEYDGTFVQDYEYIEGSGDLDPCNGHFGVTPEYPVGIYHYHITEEFPFISRHFRGTPDASFQRRRSKSHSYE